MSLFKRSAVSEILSHSGVVLSTLLIVWLSVLLVRLLGEAANGTIGPDVVLGLAAFSSITALPIILAVSLFIAVLTTVTRSFRESEMVVWFASGLSLKNWITPVLQCAVPTALLIAVLTLQASPWAYRQIAEYRQRFEQRSDLSKVTAGQFSESDDGARVFYADSPEKEGDELGNVIARVIDPQWLSIVTAQSARMEEQPNGDRFLVLSEGHRYDLKPGQALARDPPEERAPDRHRGRRARRCHGRRRRPGSGRLPGAGRDGPFETRTVRRAHSGRADRARALGRPARAAGRHLPRRGGLRGAAGRAADRGRDRRHGGAELRPRAAAGAPEPERGQ